MGVYVTGVFEHPRRFHPICTGQVWGGAEEQEWVQTEWVS